MNEIVIRGLRFMAHVGVPDAEIAHAQELVADITFVPLTAFPELGDDIVATVDYDAAARRAAEIAAERPRRLIETLAVDLAQTLLAEFPAGAVTVEIRKFILPQTDHVAVRYRCTRGETL